MHTGVGDLFYEPAAGIAEGPTEFVEGVAVGVGSLTSQVIGGTASALSRIGQHIGTGVAALSIDEKFERIRRENIRREATFSEGGKAAVHGIVSGFRGLVTKPVEGAAEDGLQGFLKGIGRGLVGAVVQPATGIIDFASTSLQAINNALDLKAVPVPVRPPRVFSTLAQEITPYNLRAATGKQSCWKTIENIC